jgi:hypothetical protein
MNLREKLEKVKEYLDAAPFTREEMEMAWAYFDDELYFTPSNIFSLSVAMNYAKDRGEKELQDELYEKYQKSLAKIKKIYKN